MTTRMTLDDLLTSVPPIKLPRAYVFFAKAGRQNPRSAAVSNIGIHIDTFLTPPLCPRDAACAKITMLSLTPMRNMGGARALPKVQCRRRCS